MKCSKFFLKKKKKDLSNRNIKFVFARVYGGFDKVRGIGYLRIFVVVSCVEVDGFGSRVAIGFFSIFINICRYS